MADAYHPSLLRRVRHTPLSDVLRGRLTGRLDVRGPIEGSGLPAPLKELIRDVVKRTRLWPGEKVGVADELIAHFADGIDDGQDAAVLAAAFGDPRAAAKLIRRAKKRNRPTAWHALNALRWLGVVLLALYGLSAAYFYAGRPSVKVNYVEDLNRPIASVPPDARAWPLYRQAIPAFRLKQPLREVVPGQAWLLTDATPDDSQWPALVRWLRERESSLELARHAAAKPALGFVYGPGGSADDAQLYPNRSATAGESNPPLINVLLPHLDDLRRIAHALAADARLAGHDDGDADRLTRDIEAMLGMADQLQENSFFVQQLVAIGIRELALRSLGDTLATRPELLQPRQLQRLAHALANYRTAADLITLRNERKSFYDVVQRMYTDDGNGDGRFTPQGLKVLQWVAPRSEEKDAMLRAAAAPVSPALMASRRELTSLYDRWMDQAEANFHRPAHTLDLDAIDREVQQMHQSLFQRVEYALSVYLTPSTQGMQTTAERQLGQRDGVLVAIALELYRRRHDGQYPATLDALVPTLLPELPFDRITGGRLHYRVVDGKPLVYSVGVDRDDDGGIPPRLGDGQPAPLMAADWDTQPAGPKREGDWVLYPPMSGK